MSERAWVGLAGAFVAGMLAQGCTEKTCGPGEIKYGDRCAVPCESIPGALCDRDGGVLTGDGQVLPGPEAGAEGGASDARDESSASDAAMDAPSDAASDAPSEASGPADATVVDVGSEVIGLQDVASEGATSAADTSATDTVEAGPDASEEDARDACVPTCTGRACGDDGCGGSCGSCLAGFVCGASGQCAQRSCPDPRERGCGVIEVAAPTEAFRVGSETVAFSGPPIDGVRVSAFALDAYEVTVARFRRFWDDAHPAPSSSIIYPGGTITWAGSVTAPYLEPMSACSWTPTRDDMRNAYPINCIDWATAMAFCVWDGGRLPTNAEWEYVARHRPVAGHPSPRDFETGTGYPDPIESACSFVLKPFCAGFPDDSLRFSRVGELVPLGGFYDLSGNLAEYIADEPERYDSTTCWQSSRRTNPLCDGSHMRFATRGGATNGDLDTNRVSAWEPSWASASTNQFRGLRCAYSR